MANDNRQNNQTSDEMKWPFGKKNYIFFGIALLVIILGYLSLASGSITLAPILLVVGYCVLIPIALIIKDNPDSDHPTDL